MRYGLEVTSTMVEETPWGYPAIHDKVDHIRELIHDFGDPPQRGLARTVHARRVEGNPRGEENRTDKAVSRNTDTDRSSASSGYDEGEGARPEGKQPWIDPGIAHPQNLFHLGQEDKEMFVLSPPLDTLDALFGFRNPSEDSVDGVGRKDADLSRR
jgi:hypothetical protein